MITARSSYNFGRLLARPDNKATNKIFKKGLQPLELDNKRDGLYYIPKNYTPEKPAALILLLHGAGGQPEHGISILSRYADEHNLLLIAPASRGVTWDIIVDNAFGKDVIFIDQALNQIFDSYVINPEQMAIGGFSDGASYALCLGLSNGDLFTHIIAFSPGFAYTVEDIGKAKIFISHGLKDRVLPIEPCSRRIVPQLERKNLLVNYIEFDGEHEIPTQVSKSGVNWFLKSD